MLTDPRLDDHPIVYANQAFLELTGYAADEVLGRNCRFLQGEDTDPAAIDELRRAIAERAADHRRPAQLPQGRHAVLERGPHRAGARPRRRGRALRRRAGRRHRLRARGRRVASAARPSSPRPARCWTRRSICESTLDSLTRLSVPFLGDVCVVDEIRHDEVRRLACAAATAGVERRCASCPSRSPRPRTTRSSAPSAAGSAEIVTGRAAASAGARATR